ncbi:flagellar biosynthesis anti-sigma factor FlgM [Helicobacter baculiformis]|uniref:Flagellar biosynthesis anti-sigma factor FlgM n=1 Tax=Helicobacter baculiformis TaxID=427351 RepID=A0ABV7ZIL9_9HELI|nr:flagellar biosynthesis anti-sigma factor FlgM [Helicobacter baculiformis]
MVKSVGSHTSFNSLSHVHGARASHESAKQSHAEQAAATDKVAQIKKSLEAGDYKVDLEKTSHKMAQSLLG